jgi:hypothetical protein
MWPIDRYIDIDWRIIWKCKLKKYDVGIWSLVIRLWAKNREGLLQFTRQLSGSIEVLNKLRHFHFPHKNTAAMQRLLLPIAIFFGYLLRGEERWGVGSWVLCASRWRHTRRHTNGTQWHFPRFSNPRLIRCRSITTSLIHIAATTNPQINPARICTIVQTMWNIRPQS